VIDCGAYSHQIDLVMEMVTAATAVRSAVPDVNSSAWALISRASESALKS